MRMDNDDEDMDDEDTDNENDNDQVLYGTADGKLVMSPDVL